MIAHLTRIAAAAATAVAVALATGCVTYKTTATARTAVEQALISQSAEATLDGMDLLPLAGRMFWIVSDDFEATDAKYTLSCLRRRLLEIGARAAASKDEAELLVYPAAANAAIDESSILIGLPAIPVVVPGVGAMTTPEMPLFRRVSQKGRNRMALFVENAWDGALAHSIAPVASERFYTSWTILFLFSYKTTDLCAPF